MTSLAPTWHKNPEKKTTPNPSSAPNLLQCVFSHTPSARRGRGRCNTGLRPKHRTLKAYAGICFFHVSSMSVAKRSVNVLNTVQCTATDKCRPHKVKNLCFQATSDPPSVLQFYGPNVFHAFHFPAYGVVPIAFGCAVNKLAAHSGAHSTRRLKVVFWHCLRPGFP